MRKLQLQRGRVGFKKYLQSMRKEILNKWNIFLCIYIIINFTIDFDISNMYIDIPRAPALYQVSFLYFFQIQQKDRNQWSHLSPEMRFSDQLVNLTLLFQMHMRRNWSSFYNNSGLIRVSQIYGILPYSKTNKTKLCPVPYFAL